MLILIESRLVVLNYHGLQLRGLITVSLDMLSFHCMFIHSVQCVKSKFRRRCMHLFQHITSRCAVVLVSSTLNVCSAGYTSDGADAQTFLNKTSAQDPKNNLAFDFFSSVLGNVCNIETRRLAYLFNKNCDGFIGDYL